MIKSLDLGDYLDYLYGTNVIIRVFINERGRQEGQSQIKRCNNKSRGQSDMFAVLKMGEGHELRYQAAS